MIKSALIIASMALAACGQQVEPGGNVSSTTNAVEKPTTQCTPPTPALADGSPLQSALLAETKANFATAFQRACAKGIMKEKPLIEPKASDQAHLVLINAPEANVASIYLSEVDGDRMVLEYPFLTTDGKSQAPTADELEEAIYCAVVGATAEEQEKSGRCLVD